MLMLCMYLPVFLFSEELRDDLIYICIRAFPEGHYIEHSQKLSRFVRYIIDFTGKCELCLG